MTSLLISELWHTSIPQNNENHCYESSAYVFFWFCKWPINFRTHILFTSRISYERITNDRKIDFPSV